MSQSLNFAEIKQQFSVLDGAHLLGLSLQEVGDSLRCRCPHCVTQADYQAILALPEGDQRQKKIAEADRSLSVKQLDNGQFAFRCFASAVSGSVLDLVCHVKQLNLREAGQWLLDQPDPADPAESNQAASKAFDPEKYASGLDSTPEALQTFGVSRDLLEKIGWMGVASKGVNRGKLVIPMRGEFGEFIDFIGVASVSLPKRWRCSSDG